MLLRGVQNFTKCAPQPHGAQQCHCAAVSVQPNILITGTPGTGKTTLCEALAERTGFTHINISDLVKEYELHDGYDAEHDTLLINEDKACLVALSCVHGRAAAGGGHARRGGRPVRAGRRPHRGPPRLRLLSGALLPAGRRAAGRHGRAVRPAGAAVGARMQRSMHDRRRHYAASKIQENVQAEIMQVVLEEATESYQADRVLVWRRAASGRAQPAQELPSNTSEDMEANLQRILQWIDAFQAGM